MSGPRQPKPGKPATARGGVSSEPLNSRAYGQAVSRLSRLDPDLHGIVERHGRPRFWQRPPGFATLVLIILEQQVSLASARAAYDRLLATVGTLDPESFLALSDPALRAAGFSRQKARYCGELARAVRDGVLPLDQLGSMSDREAGDRLQAMVGIGRWTADIYLLSALGRRDVWPLGDLALITSVQRIKRLEDRPSPAEMSRIGAIWRPWRSVAAGLLWHDYLSRGQAA